MAIHQIKWGDTLSALAVRYRTTVAALARENGIANPNLIYAGRSLRIPGGSSADRRSGVDRRAGTRPSAPDRRQTAPVAPSTSGNVAGGVSIAQLRRIMANLT